MEKDDSKKTEERANSLVAYSRAGDQFHYRWGAYRCLNMLEFESEIESIYVESTKERKAAGEYVMDLTEYHKDQSVIYYQMKHSSVRNEQNFTLSELKDTFSGFAKRFLAHKRKQMHSEEGQEESKKDKFRKAKDITYIIVTNRAVSARLKSNIISIGAGRPVSEGFYTNIKKYTKLSQRDLKRFCKSLQIMDGQGDYREQWWKVYQRAENFMVGSYETKVVKELIDMVSKRALPDDDTPIYREDVLKCFGVPSEDALFPAPFIVQKAENYIDRKQYSELKNHIWEAETPVIIHAEGGVGKSVFANYLKRNANDSDVVIVYDCFADGTYRNRSKMRHTHRIALVQIANELACQGLCDPMLVHESVTETEFMKTFLRRLKDAGKCLRKMKENARILIVIDAADNAEMAAAECREHCFVQELLREQLPEGCWLVMTCRTERMELLKKPAHVRDYVLHVFSKEETEELLHRTWGDVKEPIIDVIWKRSGGNPRILSYAMGFADGNLEKLMAYLNPGFENVDQQIEKQMEQAVNQMKEQQTEAFQQKVDLICKSLAILPPSIPIDVLCDVAHCEKKAILSFISDLGRPLWSDGKMVRFRDEPVETWFRKHFSNSNEEIMGYIEVIKKVQENQSYISETVPILLLKAGQYQPLIQYVLEDKTYTRLSQGIDKRIREFQLQTALKAALCVKDYKGAAKLSTLAGEIQAEAGRQDELIKNHVDLIGLVQTETERKDLALGRRLHGQWDGSEYIYKSSLMKDIEGGTEEAKLYLHSAVRWEAIYFQERDKAEEQEANFHLDVMAEEENLEIAYTCYRLYGLEKTCEQYLLGWSPDFYRYGLYCIFIRRLLDWGEFDDAIRVGEILYGDIYAVFALCQEFLRIGRCIPVGILKQALDVYQGDISEEVQEIRYDSEQKHWLQDGAISFIENCVAKKLINSNVLKLAEQILTKRANAMFTTFTGRKHRDLFLRGYVLRKELAMPVEKNAWQQSGKADSKECTEVFDALILWYELRLKCIKKKEMLTGELLQQMYDKSKGVLTQRYEEYDFLESEVWRSVAQVWIHSMESNCDTEQWFYKILEKEEHYRLDDQLELLYALKRNHTERYGDMVEKVLLNRIETIQKDAERVTDEYVSMARAVLAESREDAACYLKRALQAVDVIEDELSTRWEAAASLGRKAAQKYHHLRNLSNQFITCAEYIGDHVVREKYWRRYDAVRTCVSLSPVDGLAAMSRWREMQIGIEGYQIQTMAESIVKHGFLTPDAGWCLHAFMDSVDMKQYAELCQSKEVNKHIKECIADQIQKYKSIGIIKSESMLMKEEIRRTTWEEVSKQEEAWNKQMDAYGYSGYPRLLTDILQNDQLDFYEAETAMKQLQERWYGKIAFQEGWTDFLYRISKKYYIRLINSYPNSEFIERYTHNEREKKAVCGGILDGVSQNCSEQIDFFYLVEVLSDSLNPEEAKEVLKYSLDRLESHMPQQYLEKCRFYDKDEPYPDVEKALAKYIWTALGSPEREVRWKAVHAVLSLMDTGRQDIVGLVMEEDQEADVEEYLPTGFPMYKLNARLYMLAALRRCTVTNPECIRPYSQNIYAYCLREPHVLIQLYAKETALELEKHFPGCYDEGQMEQIRKVLISPYEQQEYPRRYQSHILEENQSWERFYHGYDMNAYWFKPLGEVFGLDGNQVEHMVTECIHDTWQINYDGSYQNDPRNVVYKKYQNDQNTYHSHGSYPELERYNFYLSYHALLEVAAKLLSERAVGSNRWWSDEDPWEQWIDSYRLLDQQGWMKWDYRKEIPEDVRQNCEVTCNAEWKEDYTDVYDRKVYLKENQICVNGSWTAVLENDMEEETTITSAVVPIEEADALAEFMMSHDPYDYAMPEWCEEEDEFGDEEAIPGFHAKGFLREVETRGNLSRYDSWAGEVSEKRYELSDEWFTDSDVSHMHVEKWSVPYEYRGNSNHAAGDRLVMPRKILDKIFKSGDYAVVIKVLVQKSKIGEYEMPKMKIVLIR